MNEERLADARMRTLSALSEATVHDLRGAASALGLHLQLLGAGTDDDAGRERRRRSLAVADAERRRLFSLAETFLRHAVVPDPTPIDFDLLAVTSGTVDLARPYAAQCRVELALAPGAVPRPVQGRRDVVTQVLLDVLLHVLDRSGHGESVAVAVETVRDKARTIVRASAAGARPEGDGLAAFASAMRWAGGELRVDDVITIELPVPNPEEWS